MPRGRPPSHPQDRIRGLVQGLAMSGTPDGSIARLVGIDVKTLKRHYSDELETSGARANAQVAQALFKTATDTKAGVKHITAAIFWLEARAGWRRRDDVGKATGDSVTDAGALQTLRIEFVGPEGGPEEGSGPEHSGEPTPAAPDPDPDTP